jgi:hypothetical protein
MADADPPVSPPEITAVRAAAAALDRSSAPLFDDSVGGALVRAAKRLVNLPLRVLTRPQQHFDDAARAAVHACVAAVEDMARSQLALRDALTIARATLERLGEENAALRARLARQEPPDERP